MNISSDKGYRNCTSCQLCAAVCPVGAIEIKLDSKGFYKPYIKENKCIDCSICIKYCYKFNEIEKTSDGELSEYSLYSGFAKESDIVKTTTSGGIAYIISKYCVQEGYKCVGVEYDYKKHRAKHSITSNVNEIERFKGSKYIQSYTLGAFKSIIEADYNTKYVVFGTPCQIYSLDVFLKDKKRRANFILIDIYCHGCPSMLLWDKYLDEVRLQEDLNKIQRIVFRSKLNKSWGEFSIYIEDEKKYISSNSKKYNEFYDLFFSNHLLNDACVDCKLRSTLKYTDIRLGDFWGSCYDLNTKGVSSITLVSNKGQQVFDEISSLISFKKHEFEDMLPFQSWGVKYSVNKNLQTRLFSLLSQNTLTQVVDFYVSSLPFHIKLRTKIKRLLEFFPISYINKIKWFYHKLKI